jgi:hypothetical protein
MMPPSPNAVSHPPSPESSSQVPSNPSPAAPSRAMMWMERANLFLSVMIHLYFGLFLFFVPWTQWWTMNHLLLYFAPVAHLSQNGAVRGLISGLGLLNLWVGLAEAIHYKES